MASLDTLLRFVIGESIIHVVASLCSLWLYQPILGAMYQVCNGYSWSGICSMYYRNMVVLYDTLACMLVAVLAV